MKKQLFFAFFLCTSSFLFAQQILTENIFPDSLQEGFPGYSLIFDMVEQEDGYLAVGLTDFPTGAPRQSIRLIKVDKNLELLWDTTYFKGAIEVKTAQGITATSNGNYVVVGGSNNQPYAMGIASNLDTIWTKEPFTPGGRWEAVKAVGDDVLVAGWTEIGPATQGLLQKWDANGEIIWFQSLPTSSRIYDIDIAPNGEIIAGGSFGATGQITKHDADGNLIWSKIISLSKAETVYDVEVMEDGKIVFAISGSGFAGPIPFVGMLDSDGDILWTNGTEIGIGESAAVTVRDEEIVLAGSLIGIYGFNSPGFLASFDEEGMGIPESFIDFDNTTSLSSILTDSEDCIVAAGTSEGAMYFRKTCQDIADNIHDQILFSGLRIYPQPAVDELNIEIENNTGLKNWKMFNSVGQFLQSGNFAQSNIQINLSHLPKGIYWLQIELETGDFISRPISIQ